jgi:hypothetical protein
LTPTRGNQASGRAVGYSLNSDKSANTVKGCLVGSVTSR